MIHDGFVRVQWHQLESPRDVSHPTKTKLYIMLRDVRDTSFLPACSSFLAHFPCFGKNRTQHCPRKRLFEEDPILQQGIGNPKIYFSYLHDDTTKSKTPIKNFNVSVRNDFKPLQGFYGLTDSIPLICIKRNTEQLNKSGMHRRAPNGENVS